MDVLMSREGRKPGATGLSQPRFCSVVSRSLTSQSDTIRRFLFQILFQKYRATFYEGIGYRQWRT